MAEERVHNKIIILEEDTYYTLRRLLEDCKKYASFINVAKEYHINYCKSGQLYMPEERLIEEKDFELIEWQLDECVFTTRDFKNLVLDTQDIIEDGSKGEDLIELCRLIEDVGY